MILSHSYPILLGNGDDSEPIYRATGGQRTAGGMAVEGFFLISGHLITASWQRCRGLLDFLRRRALRIYPGFLAAVAFSGLVVGPLIAPDSSASWGRFEIGEFLKNALNLNGVYLPSGLVTNGSLWSIGYEFRCYLATAVLGLLGVFRRRSLVLLFVVVCSILEARIQLHGMQMPGSRLTWLWGYPQVWPRLAASYFAGAAFHLYADRIVHSGGLALASLVGLLLAGLVPGSRALAVLFPYLGGYLIFYLAFVRAGRWKDVARWGDLSYGLYLYAFPIQLLLTRWFGPKLSTWGLTSLAIPATAALAALSWHLVERPFLAMKRTTPPDGPAHETSIAPTNPAP